MSHVNGSFLMFRIVSYVILIQMDNNNKHFEKALSDMKDNFAGRDGIKHLADLGYSMQEIRENLDFPFPMDKIGRVLWDYYVSNETILLKAPGSGAGSVNSRYIRKTDSYGKQSFIKVTEESSEAQQITWKKAVFKNNHDIFQTPFIGESHAFKTFLESNSTGGPDYVSLDLGRLKSRKSTEWVSFLSLLSEDTREYIEFMPWEKSITSVYHLIDERMTRVLSRLEKTGYMPGVFYFALRDV